MNASEAKKLVGQTIWIKRVHDWRPYPCKILEVAGKNVRVDTQGMEDWYWLPDCQVWTEEPNWSQGVLG